MRSQAVSVPDLLSLLDVSEESVLLLNITLVVAHTDTWHYLQTQVSELTIISASLKDSKRRLLANHSANCMQQNSAESQHLQSQHVQGEFQ